MNTIRAQIGREDSFYPNPYSIITSQRTLLSQLKIMTIIRFGSKLQKSSIYKPLSFLSDLPDTKRRIINQDDQAFCSIVVRYGSQQLQKLQKNERFIGLGETTGNLDRAGRAYTNWNTDYFAYGVGDDPLYMSIPFYIGIHNKLAYGIFFDNTHKTVFNFGASNNRFAYFSGDDGDLDYYFFHDDSVSGIISAYSNLTGKMEMPPLWTLGFQQCRYSYYPDSEVTTLAQTFRDKDMPADVIYLDIHHMEKYKVFTFDGQKFPDPKSMVSALKKKL